MGMTHGIPNFVNLTRGCKNLKLGKIITLITGSKIKIQIFRVNKN